MPNTVARSQLSAGRGHALSVTAQQIVVAVTVGLFILSAGVNAFRKDITQGFDEVAQTSYVAQLQSTGETWPRLETLKLLDPASLRFTDSANYLNHPPLYYDLLAQLGPRLEGHAQAVVIDRLLNVVLATLGLAALLAIGLLARLPLLTLYAYCVPLACVPVLAPLAGSIQNDNATFAAGAVATLAVWQLAATGRRAWLLAALAAVVVAAWAKLTGLLLVGGMVGGVLAWMMLRRQLPLAWAMPIAVALLLAAAPYLIFIAQYGSPTPNTPAQAALLETGAQATGWQQAARMSFPAYVLYFMTNFIADWMPALAPRNAFQYAMLVLPVGAALCAIGGIALSAARLWRRQDDPIDAVIVAGALVFAATLAVHVVYSYGRHVSTGWMLDAYPRYYLPLVAIVPLAGLSLLAATNGPRRRAALTAFLIAGPILFRLLGTPLG
jgi:hypothetical protein